MDVGLHYELMYTFWIARGQLQTCTQHTTKHYWLCVFSSL